MRRVERKRGTWSKRARMLAVAALLAAALVLAGGCDTADPADESTGGLDPDEHNVGNLRVNARFRESIDAMDPGRRFDEGDLYWVPAAAAGLPDSTTEELLDASDDPEELRDEVGTLFEAIAFVQASGMRADGGGNEEKHTFDEEGRISWELPRSPEGTIEDGEGNCADVANMVAWLLEGDYDEVGLVWETRDPDRDDPGGHVVNYVVDGGTHYRVDPTAYVGKDPGDPSYPPEETGRPRDFSGNLGGAVWEIPGGGDPDFTGLREIMDYAGEYSNITMFPVADKPLGFLGMVGSHSEEPPDVLRVREYFPMDEMVEIKLEGEIKVEEEHAPEWEDLY